ncbi:MAG: preprotein translocase subunit SecE [Pirellulales bacterium]
MGAFVQELFSLSLYKRSQGRVARQATFGALAVIVTLAAWSLRNYFGGMTYTDRPTAEMIYVNVIPLIVLVSGLWVSFRIVQVPNFADFLISVEGEMNKVSWPSRDELIRASIVVMFVIFFLAGILFVYDLALEIVMKLINQGLDWVGRLFGG